MDKKPFLLRSLFLTVLLLTLICSTVHAGTFTALGPLTFTREIGKPLIETVSFAVKNPDAAYTLQVYNGGVEGAFEKVSSALVSVNGRQIFGPDAFNQNVRVLENAVTLQTRNELSVELRGKPESVIVINIIGIDNDLPVITAAVSPQPNEAGWNNTDVTVAFSCYDATSGIAVCTAPVRVDTEGESQDISGMAVDDAGNTASASVTINIDRTQPAVSVISPQPGSTINNPKPAISIEYSNSLSGIDISTVRLAVDGLDVTSSALITEIGITYTPDTPLKDGDHTVSASISDKAGNTNSISISFITKTKQRPFIFPEPGFDAGAYRAQDYSNFNSKFNGPIEVGDINIDGILDVVVINNVSYAGWSFKSRISVILGRGNGSFERPIQFAEVAGVYTNTRIALGNFNGDAYPDVAMVSGYKLYIFLGNGDGTFFQKIDYSINTGGRVLTGCFDGDGYEDIALVGSSGSILIYRGKGDGSFRIPQEIRIGSNYSSVVDTGAVDFNSDGITDIAAIVGNHYEGGAELIVLLGGPDGEFNFSTVLVTADNIEMRELSAGDFNGDGHLDILVTRQKEFSERVGLTVLMGDGRGGFYGRVDSETGMDIDLSSYVLYGERVIRTKDLNGDKKSDLLIAHFGKLYKFLSKGDGTFEDPVVFNVAGGSMNTGDFDNDGAEDIVTVGVDHIFILFGKEDGAFIDRKEIPTREGSFSILSADFDGDNTPDIATPGGGRGTLFSTILNRGNDWSNNTFQGSQTYRVGNGPVAVKMADLNGDGQLDIVTTNELSRDISVMLNTGGGNLKTPTSYPAGGQPNFIAIQDLNGDGNLDILTVNDSSDSISILLGKGDGTFQAHKVYFVGTSPRGLVIEDFNRDGKSDIIVIYSNTSNYVSVLMGNGDGTFQPYTNQTVVDWWPSYIIKSDANETVMSWDNINNILAKDLNRDGKLDLITMDAYHYHPLTVLIGDGYGQFQQRQQMGFRDYLSAAIADLNNDGDVDLLVGSENSLDIRLGNGDGTFRSGTSIGGWEGVLCLDIGDINGDSIPDIALVDYENLSIIYGNDNGTFPGEAEILDLNMYSGINLALADFNSDHNQDIAISMYPSDWWGEPTGTTKTVFYWGSGNNTFSQGAVIDTSSYRGGKILTGAFNNDSLPDLAFQNVNSNTLSIFLNKGNGIFGSAIPTSIKGLIKMVEDANSDGNVDIISIEAIFVSYGNFSYNVHIYTGSGEGTFQYHATIPLSGRPCGMATGDFNGDGFPDVTTSICWSNNTISRKIEVFMNIGDGTFDPPIVYEVEEGPGSLIAEDFNQDRHIDIGIQSGAMVLSLLMGNGDGTFNFGGYYSTGIYWDAGMESRDFNSDGRPDIALADRQVPNVQLLLNILPPLRTPPSPPKALAGKAGNGTVSLSWAANPETDLAGYNVYRSLSAGGGYAKINNSILTSLSYTDTTVINGVTYYYTVSAVDTGGDESSYAKKVKATPSLPDTTPPVVKITTPVNGKTVLASTLFVSGTIDDTTAGVTVNGITGTVQKQGGAFTAYGIPLTAGENTITATAKDPSGNRAFDIVKVTYVPAATITGTIKDELTGQPVSSADVFAADTEKTQKIMTGADGRYTFTKIFPGEVAVRVEPNSPYIPITINKMVSSGETLTLDIPLRLTAAKLRGGVYDASTYWPIAGATVTVTDRAKTQIVTTDTSGGYEVTDITPYDVTITVSKPGFETYTEKRTLSIRWTNWAYYYLKSLPPSIPTGLAATSGVGYVELAWNQNPEDNIKGYNIYRTTTSGSGYTKLTPSPVTSLYYKDTAVTAGTTYYYVITAINTSSKESGYSSEVSATPIEQKIVLAITSPADGATINKSRVIIKGTVDTTLPEVGVIVEVSSQSGTVRYLAHLNGRLFAAIVPLEAGANVIRVVATDGGENSAEAGITVNAALTTEDIRLTVNPDSGIPMPKEDGSITFDAALEAEAYIANEIAKYEWDFDGDGTPEQTGTALEKVTASYQIPGIHYPTVTITDAQGNNYTETEIVNVLDRTIIDTLLKFKWEGMKRALKANDINGAMTYLGEGIKAKFGRIFNLLGADLLAVITQMPDINLVSLKGDVAKYYMKKVEDGKEYAYFIYFAKDINGFWKIENF